MSVDAGKIVKALRDVVAKAREKRIVQVQRSRDQWSSEPPPPYEEDAVTRDEIIGRIAGLADAIEAIEQPS